MTNMTADDTMTRLYIYRLSQIQISVCAKGLGFPYILLTAQEVHVYLVAMIALRHALPHERKMYVC